MDSSVRLICRDPSDLGSKILIWIISKERIPSYLSRCIIIDLYINWNPLVHSYNNLYLRHTYSACIQNTFSKIQVLYICNSSLCHVKFRGKSIYISFLSSHFPWIQFKHPSKGMHGDKLKASCELTGFIETLISRVCWRGEDTELIRLA